ncbi:hypothetical protein GPECTOR_47g376 [Gonium pectorale]|uniref:Uncharacterized protein n=1 Tax=Gonium pectorale TaxID=33097 RepID=A0A150G8B6_GONPE|nr:hypothetical protein GPECTOR_47g376 [Gonium pectorale]|eukprot:KXZ46099.1 hypothetical protein GPECTOR_47g376 [Gonium pectorale]
MVKVRLLLAGLFVPRTDRARLQPLLSELTAQAAGSQDEWVRATAAVVGDHGGPLCMRTLMAQFPLVRDTMTGLSSTLQGLHTPAGLLPQSEQYMHADISRLPPGGLMAGGTAPAGAGAAGAGGSGQGTGAGAGYTLRDPPAVALVDFGLPGARHAGSSGGGGGGGGSGGVLPGFPSGGADARGALAAAVAGSGTDPLARRGLGGGETSVLRSRADVLHSAFKDAKQAPPTPKAGNPIPGLGLSLRLSRARSTTGPDSLALELAGTPSTLLPPGFHAPASATVDASGGGGGGGVYPHHTHTHSHSTAVHATNTAAGPPEAPPAPVGGGGEGHRPTGMELGRQSLDASGFGAGAASGAGGVAPPGNMLLEAEEARGGEGSDEPEAKRLRGPD